MSDDVRNVSGVWYGSWTSESPTIYPNSFIAQLDEVDGAISGSTSEADYLADVMLHALVSGRRAGAKIEWLKQYDAAGRLAHAVFYSGLVNDDGTQIEGSWRIAGYQGAFAMQREKFSAEELANEEEIGVGRL